MNKDVKTMFKTRWTYIEELNKKEPFLTKAEFMKVLKSLEKKGMIEIEDDKVFFTKTGMEIMNKVQRKIDEKNKDVT